MSKGWRWTERGLWVGALTLGVAGTGRARRAERTYQVVGAWVPAAVVAPDRRLSADSARADSIVTALEALEARNPFERAGAVGRPATPAVAIAPISPPPRVPRPVLGLRGVVGVAPGLRAVIDGVPGTEGGVLLAVGDTIRGLRVRRITADTVVIQSADAVWRLGMRRSWQ